MNELLAADVGNSASKVGLFQGARLSLRWAFPTPGLSARAICERIESSIERKGKRISRPPELAVCAVVPQAVKTWRQVARMLGARMLTIRGDTPAPLHNEYRRPAALGPDRLAAAVGAASACGTPVIVVNAGTATTVDAVSADGRFLGGAICLGVGSALEALAAAASLLPALLPARARTPMGRDTRQSILAGSYFGTIGQINEIVTRQRAVVGKDAPVAATGGFASLVAGKIGGTVLIRPNLTLEGIRLIWLHKREAGGPLR